MRMRSGASRTFLPVVMAALLAAGCATKAKKTESAKPDANAKRISVLSFQRNVEADAGLSAVPVTLSRPYVNPNWTKPGGSGSNNMYHLDLGASPALAWKAHIGHGASDFARLLGEPVIVNGTVYTIDSEGEVSAFKASNGAKVWGAAINPEKREKGDYAYGGGVAYGAGRIYATTGYGIIAAFDAESGKEVWRYAASIPLRGGPSYSGGRVFMMTQDNQVIALAADNGGFLWNMAATPESASIMGAASLAPFGDVVVAAFSSGELYALQAENGRVAWQDQLSRTGSLTPLAALADIDGQPVIDRGRVYAASHAGRTVAIDMRSGERIWEANAGSTNTPWVGGDFLFSVTNEQELVALSAADGRVKWVTQLQKYVKPEKRKGNVRWSGPVLAGNRLIVASSEGYVLSVSPYDGRFLSWIKVGAPVTLTPVVADKTLYILADDGTLFAWR